MTKELQLSDGNIALVDDADYALVSRYRWHTTRTHGRGRRIARLYARYHDNANHCFILLHRLVLNAPPGVMVDHINGDGLDCRRSNLRFCTRSQNGQNSRGRRVSSASGFKGVSWHKQVKRWRAEIQAEGHCKHLGCFDEPKDAARAYDRAALKYFGDFARLNFPLSDYRH